MLGRLPIAITLLTLSCSSSVELTSGPPPVRFEPSSDPTVLGVINERVTQIAVDDQRLYWLGLTGETTTNSNTAIRGCAKDDCVNSLVTYTASSGSGVTWSFFVSEGRVYWLTQDLGGQTWHNTLRSCDAAGCSDGSSRAVVLGENGTFYDSSGSDAFYSCSDVLQRIPLSGADPVTLHTFGSDTASSCQAPVAHGEYVYWWISDGSFPPRSTIQRMRTDGTGAIETLVEGLQIPLQPSLNVLTPPYSMRLAFDAAYVYWTQGTLHGSIARCPLSGCVGDPEIVVDPIRSPLGLLSDGTSFYWEHDTESQGYAVSKCPLSGCTPSTPLLTALDWTTNAFAVDDQYLYAATSEQPLNSDDAWPNPAANIRRVAK